MIGRPSPFVAPPPHITGQPTDFLARIVSRVGNNFAESFESNCDYS
jgi:hypothetical protein